MKLQPHSAPLDLDRDGSSDAYSEDHLDLLTESQRSELSVLLERYLIGLETGHLESADDLTRDHPELVQPLHRCIDGLLSLHRLSIGIDSPIPHLNLDRAWEQNSDNPLPSLDIGIESALVQKDLDANSPPSTERAFSKYASLGDFELEQEIGRGGMGVVFRARQRSLQRTVAVKLLPLANALNRTQIQRFQNEAEIAAALHHPHIVSVFAFGQEHGIHYYAMQWVDGESIDQWIVRQRNLIVPVDPFDAESRQNDSSHDISAATPTENRSWRECVEWGIQAADALHAAHMAGVIHRDVKPSNLMVDRQGQIWLTDFGLARVTSDQSLTRSGDVVGTMRYMSPEQARGDQALVDGRTDVYALGVTLYEMLSLSVPFAESSPLDLLASIETKYPKPLRQIVPNVPKDLDSVVVKAMAKRREDRYGTAKLFAEDLQRVLSGVATYARAPTPLDRVIAWGMRNRRAVITTLSIGFVLLLGLLANTLLLESKDKALNASQKELQASHQREAEKGSLARRTIDRLGTQIAELMQAQPTNVSIRQTLLRETLACYESLDHSSDDDPKLQRDLAITYGKIGTHLTEIRATSEAIEALRKSELIFAKLVKSEPEDWKLHWQWSISQNNLGESIQQSKPSDEAMDWLQQAMASQTSLLKDHPEVANDLAATQNNIGLWMAANQRNAEGIQQFEMALDTLRDVSQPCLLRATTQANLSALLIELDPNRAVTLLTASLVELKDPYPRSRSDLRLAKSIIACNNQLGRAHWHANRFDSAVGTWSEAVKLAQELWLRYPDHESIRMELATSLNHLGAGYISLAKFPQAENQFEQAKLLLRERLQSLPEDARAVSLLGCVLNNLSVAYKSQGLEEPAKRTQKDALALQLEAIEKLPDNQRFRDYLHQQLIHRESFH